MARVVDITGTKFGRLTVVEHVGSSKDGKAMWKCMCDCGNEKIASGKELRAGHVKSCGCLKHVQARNSLRLDGERFGRLSVVKRVGSNSNNKSSWLCVCDCGNEKVVGANDLRNGRTLSCGCLKTEATKTRSITHGKSQSRLYHVWMTMKQRCYNKNSNVYRHYGGRGITVCDEWRNSFSSFEKWAIDNGYDQSAQRGKCTLDRINVDGNYEPSNCRFVDMKVQVGNRRKCGKEAL